MVLNSDTCVTCGLNERTLREQIAHEISADHAPMVRQTYDAFFEACACGYMRWPCELGIRAAAVARGRL